MYLCDVYTIPANLSGHPGMSVPFGTGADDLPVGVQVLAGTLCEPQMFRAAAALERSRLVSAIDGLPGDWQLVVGLEVHVELATVTKLFSASPNRFGDEPNTNIDPVTLGLPGALPVLNRQAVELAMRIGLALNCTIQPCTFHRKNYFYPDMPKAYQISQYDQPLNVDGFLALPDGTRIGIERAHLEEDTGKSTHFGGSGGRIHGSDYSLIDFNRAGVPLVEIVSRPDIRTAEQARQYVTELRGILLAVGASDAKMEEGSMRVDANVSVHKPGTPARHALRDQERQQRALDRPGHRVRGAPPDRSAREPATTSARRPATGTRATAAPTPCAARRTPTTTATSSSPISCRWSRRRNGSPRCAPRCRCCLQHGGPGLAEATGVAADSEAAMVVVDRGQDDYVLAVGAAGGDVARALVHVKEAWADVAVGAGRRPRQADDDGGQRRAHRDAGQGRASPR